MSEWKPRRFWKDVAVERSAGGYCILLDGRPVKTPGKVPLDVPTEALAREIAAEWQAQPEVLDPSSMPFTRTANSAIDKVRPQLAEVARLISDYADSDLICYRADFPDALVERQNAAWDPLLDWAAHRFGARLEPRTGIMHRPQPAESVRRLAEQIERLGAFELAAMHDLVTLSGSLVIGLATANGYADAERLWQLSRLDETWQRERWGEDEEALEAENERAAAFLHAALFFALCRAECPRDN